jgi:hypothetical protein
MKLKIKSYPLAYTKVEAGQTEPPIWNEERFGEHYVVYLMVGKNTFNSLADSPPYQTKYKRRYELVKSKTTKNLILFPLPFYLESEDSALFNGFYLKPTFWQKFILRFWQKEFLIFNKDFWMWLINVTVAILAILVTLKTSLPK